MFVQSLVEIGLPVKGEKILTKKSIGDSDLITVLDIDLILR